MSSDAVVKKLLSSAPHRGSPVREFLAALRDRHTYAPTQNSYVLFGFLWGLPIPFFSMAIDLWASGAGFSAALLLDRPIHLLFLAHPLLFAVVFGAMGTVRARKDREIMRLLAEVERRAEELSAANEKLKELDHLKAQFMANVTHELKTPLVAIRGYNEGILEGRFGPITDRQRNGLEVAVRNVDRLRKLIEELLEFERIDSGALKLNQADFDLAALIRQNLESFRPEIDRKRLRVQLRLSDALPVHADREQIGHVILNLLSNAIKFSPGGAPVGVTSVVGEDDGKVLVKIWDRGPGIATDAQKYLFTRFWQADGSSRRRHGGTGLGLAIVKGILDAHGSAVRIVSSEKDGTSVEFPLPLAEPAAAHAKGAIR